VLRRREWVDPAIGQLVSEENGMITMIKSKAKRIPILVAAACSVALTAGSLTAVADIPPPPAGSGEGLSTVWSVYTEPGYLRIYLTDDSNTYEAYGYAPPGCPDWIQTPDTMKNYAAMTQAALLSGKKLRISYNICRPADGTGPYTHIGGMEIFQFN
jgi:hypothetical protein